MSKLVLFPSLDSISRTPEQMAIINLLDRLEEQAADLRELRLRVRQLERESAKSEGPPE